MDILKMQADLAKLQAQTMRLFAEDQKISREQRWLTPLVAFAAVLAVGAGFSAVCVQFAKMFAG
ncbi:hypothetical protein [Paraburkholderia strydomiana]|jgi:hypothetical protein|uniref:hypothetical protein n=1 Tax=Paraburkholderia strydomiana TaxID=1245417 RepID=UPI0038B6E6E0